MTLAEIAGLAYIPEGNLPEGMEAGPRGDRVLRPGELHVAVRGARGGRRRRPGDRQGRSSCATSRSTTAAPPINPNLIDGQIHGGVVHAIGQALFEQVAYDDDGQLLTGTFVVYALPSAAELPIFETDRTETPSPVNSLGVKGIGEARHDRRRRRGRRTR